MCVGRRFSTAASTFPSQTGPARKFRKIWLADQSLAALRKFGDHKVYNIVHLIYRSKNYEGQSKDYEFSALSVRDHWTTGYRDTVVTLANPEVLERPKGADRIVIFDCATPDASAPSVSR